MADIRATKDSANILIHGVFHGIAAVAAFMGKAVSIARKRKIKAAVVPDEQQKPVIGIVGELGDEEASAAAFGDWTWSSF